MYHNDLGQFASKGKNKQVKPYIPHFGRKPNPNFKYDINKIKNLIADIEPETVKSSEVPNFSNFNSLEQWVKPLIQNQRNIKILSDNEDIVISNNSVHRSLHKQDINDKEMSSVFFKIKKTLEKAKYYDFEPKNEEHKDKRIQGQYVYFSKIIIGTILYQIRFKIDVPIDEDVPLLYAGHRIKKI